MTIRKSIILLIIVIICVVVAFYVITTKEAQAPSSDEVTFEEGGEEDGVSPTPTFIEKRWQWSETQYGSYEVVVPERSQDFILTFHKTGTFSATTDCNDMAGDYSIDMTESQLSFSNIVSTKKACLDDTQEEMFRDMILHVASYEEANGTLILTLEKGGVMVFSSTI